MAKSRHSTALFEVIAKGRPLNGQGRGGLLRMMSRWFGGRAGSEAVMGRPVAVMSSSTEGSGGDGLSGVGGADVGGEQGGRLSIDSDRYEITFRMSYASAIICAFALVTVVGAAFIAGRKLVWGPKPAFAGNTTQQLRAGQASPEVLRLEKKAVDVAPVEAEGMPAKQESPEGQQGAAATPKDRKRVAGLNYVIIQGYPQKEEKMASEAVKVLTENGIDCTIEKNLPRWAMPGWHVVVGLEGFERISNSARYEAYQRKIKEISDKYVKNKKTSFKAFEPKAYRWGAGTGN